MEIVTTFLYLIGLVAHINVPSMETFVLDMKALMSKIDTITSHTNYKIILIKINTQLFARIALLSDCDKYAVYRNIFTASFVIYPVGGGIKRFHLYVENGVSHILLQFKKSY